MKQKIKNPPLHEFKTGITRAWVFASGHIHFSKASAVVGALMMMEAPPKVRKQIEVLARHSRTDDDIFIPGMPEALDQEMAYNEMRHFEKVVNWALMPKSKRSKEWPKRDFKSVADNPMLALAKAERSSNDMGVE